MDTIKGLKPQNNYVLCLRIKNNFQEKTKGGLQRVAESYHRDQYLTQNVERVFEVAELPEELTEVRGYWKTKIDLKKGDKIFVQYHDSLFAKVIKTADGKEYRMILYYHIIAALRKEKIIPVNGYLLFTPVYQTYKTKLNLAAPSLKVIDYRYGVIEYTSYPNYYYTKSTLENADEGIDVKKGDKVIFTDEFNKFAPELENDIYKILGKKYYYCQRCKIAAKTV
jgi:co-chaperonin GroES (HSP10)